MFSLLVYFLKVMVIWLLFCVNDWLVCQCFLWVWLVFSKSYGNLASLLCERLVSLSMFSVSCGFDWFLVKVMVICFSLVWTIGLLINHPKHKKTLKKQPITPYKETKKQFKNPIRLITNRKTLTYQPITTLPRNKKQFKNS